jgi:two-component system chemotaxis sensor kinase CheA
VVHAENGRACLKVLEDIDDVDIILMDIMMPEMDGHETMEAVRSTSRYGRIPIVALTAKAMKGDREKCLQSGATDYVAKPVDLDQLFSVLRVCLGNQTTRTPGAPAKRRKLTPKKGGPNGSNK